MKRRMMDYGVQAWCWGSGVILVGGVLAVLGFVVMHGWRTLNSKLFFGDTPPWPALRLQAPVFDGLFPAVVGTVCLVFLSVTWAIPLGLAAGIYLAEYAPRRLKAGLSLVLDIMAGIPSILIGLFGLAVAILLHRHVAAIRPCLLLSSLSLAILVLPYLIRSTQVSLEELPPPLRLTAPALGASPMQNLWHVLLPRSATGIFSGIILAIGRCAEDTAVILLTGVVVMAGVPRSVLGAYEALPFYIYYIAGNHADQQELARGHGAALVLVTVCLCLFLLAAVVRRRFQPTRGHA